VDDGNGKEFPEGGQTMSIFSDHKVGAISDWEFEQECRRMNREDRYERDIIESLFDGEDEEDEE